MARGPGFIERALHWYSRARTRLYTLCLASQFKHLGPGARVAPPFRFWGLHQISLGEGVMINRDCWIHVIGHYGDSESAKLIIERHAGIGMGSTISAAEQIVIEEHALLARNVYIADHAHAFSALDVPISIQGIDQVAPVRIGREAWLGQNVVVLPGVTIGQHAVIGANSVVNSSIPDFSVAVGAPARVVKQYNPRTQQWERVGANAPGEPALEPEAKQLFSRG